ncbi:hypothetical protein H2200_003766 [Cladophialophora chaetospira]|uniref:BZIP transcription factor n=1 Tax=Cladophialophora chaetospira TaxID=386627 RepID=A0AA39CKA0_9EURO|nr:hypothetical protein H2200_003766 [Cladophialophora chaetospira]
MPALSATVSNTSSRRATVLSQKNSEKKQNGSVPDTKSGSDEPTPKRPKRTLKLTASQRERKRAIDREAQRSIRLKTKNYIAHLENLVRIMENGGSNTNGGEPGAQSQEPSTSQQEGERARALLSQLRHSEEEVRNLKEMLFGVQKLVGSALAPTDEEAESKWLALASTCNGDQALRNPNMPHHDHLENCASVYSQSSDSSSPVMELGYQPYDQSNATEAFSTEYTSKAAGSQPYTTQQQDLYNSFGRFSAPAGRPEPPTSGAGDVSIAKEEGDLFLLTERQVNRVLAGGHQSFTNQPLDEDIIVRAVLHGWRDVQDEYLLDKGWQALRTIDQCVFRESGVVERMAILYMMRLKLLHQSNINPQYLAPLPPFFQRGAQEDPEVLKTTPIIEHFIWPGLRSSLCRNPKWHIDKKYSDAFRHSLKFVWPFDISDLYSKDFSTQLYSITPEFKQRQWDLRSWTMKREYFALATEMIGAIPVYEAPLNRALIPAGSMPIQTATHARQASQGSLLPSSVAKLEEREEVPSQMALAPSSAHAPSQINGSGPQVAMEMAGTQVPYSADVEAWLGDPDMVPQYWSMSSGMNVGYDAGPQQWPAVQRGFGR